MDMLRYKLITCQKRNIFYHVTRKRVTLFNAPIAAGISKTRRMLSAFKMVAQMHNATAERSDTWHYEG